MALPMPGGPDADSDRQQKFDRLAQQFPLPASSRVFQQVPQARVYHSVNQSIATSTVTVLAFDSERWDLGTAGMHDTVTNSGRFTIVTPGLYSITLNIRWANNATGNRVAKLRVNNLADIALDTRTAVTGDVMGQTATTQYRFVAGDYVEAAVYQSSGGALNVEAAGNNSPEYSISWLSP